MIIMFTISSSFNLLYDLSQYHHRSHIMMFLRGIILCNVCVYDGIIIHSSSTHKKMHSSLTTHVSILFASRQDS